MPNFRLLGSIIKKVLEGSQSLKNLKFVFWGRHRKFDFLPIFNINRQSRTCGESGVSGGGEKPNIKQIAKKKKIGQKISKIGEIRKK